MEICGREARAGNATLVLKKLALPCMYEQLDRPLAAVFEDKSSQSKQSKLRDCDQEIHQDN